MCNANKMRPTMRKHLHGYIWRNTHLFINQTKSAIISQVYIWHLFLMGEFWKGTTTIHIKIIEVQPFIKFDFNYSKTQIHLLDIAITKTSTGNLLTTLNRKTSTANLISIENQRTLKFLNESSPISKCWD